MKESDNLITYCQTTTDLVKPLITWTSDILILLFEVFIQIDVKSALWKSATAYKNNTLIRCNKA